MFAARSEYRQRGTALAVFSFLVCQRIPLTQRNRTPQP
jgi:hypothetical protein